MLALVLRPASAASAFEPLDSKVTAYDLIVAMNTLRVSNGLPALAEDSIIDAVAQSTAQIMAANQMSWHIGNVSGRLQSAGYGGGSKVWGTENFAVGGNLSIDQIMQMWSDASHMIPAVNAAYCNIGAGTAKASNGMTYYILQAAYTAGKSCGSYTTKGGTVNEPGGSTDNGRVPGVSQLIVPVKIATPDADGKIYHVVEAGQSFWSIAVAYKITIQDLETWNNLSRNSSLQIGEKLFIPGPNTAGYATPTPVGMIVPNAPDPDGKIIHTVAAYQTLSTIAQAYGTNVDTILALNAWQIDWPLQIGQKLVVHPSNVTPSPTPRPLKPIEKLTPASDGKYYHTVQNGENLSWIAGLYEVPVTELMAWNGLDGSSVLKIGQRLLLQVTPPVPPTATPRPVTVTPTATQAPDTATPSQTPTQSASLTAVPDPPAVEGKTSLLWLILVGFGAGGAILVVFLSRKKP